MILTSLLAMVLSLAFIGSSSAQDAQVVLDSIHNSTGLPGTWSSGAKNVLTGAVSLFSFHPFYLTSSSPPRTLQILAICRSLIQKQQASLTRCAYSRCLFLIISLIFHHCFSTGDGYYESSRYRFTSNGVLNFNVFSLYYALISPPGSHPTCITGVVVWVHGTYTLNPNGSITMKPFGDGFQQVQDPCAAVSNFIEPYNDIELYQYWRIFTDPVTGYHLHLYQFDGSPLPPQFQVSTSPNMLPTQLLRNATAPSPSNSTSLGGALQSSAENLWRPPNQWILGAMTAVAAVLIAI